MPAKKKVKGEVSTEVVKTHPSLSSVHTGKYPDGIVDKECYDKYIVLQAQLQELPDRYPTTSDPTLYLDMLTSIHHLRKKTEHLPKDEVDKLLKVHKKVQSMKGKLASLKKKSYGYSRKMGVDTTILDGKAAHIVELFGRYYSETEVHEALIVKFGIEVNMNSIKNFRRNHAEDIKRRQEAFSQEFSDIRLGYKRSRLEELAYIYRTRKTQYKNGYNREDGKELRMLLEQLRKEVEGDKQSIDINVRNNAEAKIEMHIYNQLMEDISVKCLIVARVAGRMKVNPLILMERLTSGFYAKYTGFAEPDRDKEEVARIYPSSLIYDFNKLEKRSERKTVFTAHNVVEAEIIPDDEKEQLTSIKNGILKRIIDNRIKGNEEYKEKREPFDKGNEEEE